MSKEPKFGKDDAEPTEAHRVAVEVGGKFVETLAEALASLDGLGPISGVNAVSAAVFAVALRAAIEHLIETYGLKVPASKPEGLL